MARNSTIFFVDMREYYMLNFLFTTLRIRRYRIIQKHNAFATTNSGFIVVSVKNAHNSRSISCESSLCKEMTYIKCTV